MRPSILFFLSVIVFNLNLSAQRELNNPLLNSATVIDKGVALHDQGKYKEAIAAYLQVPASDTNYTRVLHELILSYYNDSNFVAAEQYARLALERFPENSQEWYAMLADVYDDSKRVDEALKIYDTVLTQNPYNYLAYFNKGVCLFRAEKYDEATLDFQRCALLNPYHTSTHYFLGKISLLKGNLVQAMMSFATNLLLSPGNHYQKNAIHLLNSIAEMNTDVTVLLKKYKPGKTDDFDIVQEIITSKIALDKKYKLQADIEDQIVRQLQAMMEKLEYNASDKGFWMQYYVPLFKNLYDHKKFEPLVFEMFSKVDIKKVNDYVDKEKKKINEMSTEAVNYLNGIRESQELQYTNRETAKTRYYIKNYLITGKGEYTKTNKGENEFTGPWEFYHQNGRIKSKGNFDGEGKRTGEWKYYYNSGIPQEITIYEKDLAQGKSEVWHDNGLTYSLTNYKNDQRDGPETTYFYSGQTRSVINYKMGKKEGPAKYYTLDGSLQATRIFSDDKQEGEEIFYYSNGKISSKAMYVNDNPSGEYNEYYDNGKLKRSGAFEEGKKTGAWKSFYKNGQPEYVENYAKNELDGEYAAYYEDGKPETKTVYRKGEIDGKKEDYDVDAVLYCETIFEKGRLRDIKFFDKAGQVISNTSSRKGNADIVFYSPDGFKTRAGYFTKDGQQDGQGFFYYKNGKKSSEVNYKDGLLEGKRIQYYSDGKVSQEGTYAKNEPEGYFVNYYNNGQVSNEGWYVNGEKQGTFLYYNQLGNLTSKVYYLNDKIQGITEYYHPDGKHDYDEYYDNAWFNKLVQYDSSGKISATSEVVKGNGKMSLKHFNGKPYIEAIYKNYTLNGIYRTFNGDGSTRSQSFYKNGLLDSSYKAWFSNGKLEREGSYHDGEKTGAWKYYWRNGQLSEIEVYEEGKVDGKDIQYNEDGSVDKEINFKKGTMDGESKIFADNKQLAIVLYYRNDVLTGYSYEDKSGNLVPVIPLKGGSGTATAYFRSGVKSAFMEFSESNIDGQRIIYASNGKEYIAVNRINGDQHGLKKIYYPSGKIMKEENYFYGNLHGVSKHYNENGSLISELNYYDGDLHGVCKYYEGGKPAETEMYYYGLLESKK